MRTIQLLDPEDRIDPNDWYRPLSIVTANGGHSDYVQFRSTYGGFPENNARWVRVADAVGKTWMGKTVAEFNAVMSQFVPCGYEFVRGAVPCDHTLPKSEWKDL